MMSISDKSEIDGALLRVRDLVIGSGPEPAAHPWRACYRGPPKIAAPQMRVPRGPFEYRCDPTVPAFADDRPVVIFDGTCVLCSGFVQFILRHDTHETLRLLDAETPLGQALFEHFGLNHVDYETIILLEDGRARLKSDGAIRIFESLGFPWSLMAIAKFLPRTLRDRAYEMIARHRYQWFGRRQTCYLPKPSDADRFIA